MTIMLFLIILIFAGALPVSLGLFFYNQQRKQLVVINSKVSDQQIIELARQNEGEINAVMLAEQTDLSLEEAKAKINQLWTNGILKQKWDWSDWQNVHAKYYLHDAQKKYSNTPLISSIGANKVLSKVTDSELINLALQNKGVLSASLVCVKLNVSIDEAKQKLEELRQKDIFVSEVNENGALVYRLIDSDLIN
jgi:predicted ArsR family transcriptional regulator